MKLKIRTKLLIGFALLLALSSLVQALSFSITGDYIYSQMKSFQLVEAKKGATEIRNFFNDLNTINRGLAKAYKTDTESSSASTYGNLIPVINATLLENEHVQRITFLTPLGREFVKFEQNKGETPKDQLNYEVYSSAFKTAIAGKTSVSKVYYLEKGLGPHLDVFTPIFIDNTVPVIIKMQIGLEKLGQTLSDIKIGENGYIYVVDEEGRLIAHPSQKFVLERPKLVSRKIIASVLKNITPSQAEEQYKNEKNEIATAKAVKVSGINWVVVFEQPTSEALGFVDFMRGLFIATLFGSLLVLLLIALFLSENLTRPIQKLQHLAQLLEKGEVDNKIRITTGDEIESLANAFSTMSTELLQREDYLKKEKQQRETLLQSLTDAVVAVDSENKIILFNKEAERIMNSTAESILNKNIDEVLHVYDQDQHLNFSEYKQQTEDMMRKLKEKGIYLVNHSGEKVKITISSTPVISETHTQSGWVITIHDMRKEQELEEMKLDFVSMAAHELRTPLTAIRGYASLLNIQIGQNLDSAGKELINRLLISTENLSNLIDNLLNVSRIERDAFRVELKPVDITGLVKDIVDGFKPQAYTQNQKLELQLPLQPLPKAIADPFRIGQVLLNLITNSLNYTQEGGSIVVSAEHKDGFVQVAVKDNGTGIPKEALPKLFTKFFRVGGQLEQGSKGTGLGLFICKSIIEMHSGRIWVESELNKGSTFTFALPIATENYIEEYNKNVKETTLTQKNGDSMMIRK